MTEPLNLPQRRSIRLSGYDYAAAGAYYITLCTQERRPLFGSFDEQARLRPTAAGYVVLGCWHWLAQHYAHVELAEFVLMPDHLHGVIVLHPGGVPRKPLGQLIGAFKTVSAKHLGQLAAAPSVPVWQRNYYEHIVRDAADHARIAGYIAQNPARWVEKYGYGPHPAQMVR